MAVSTDVSDVDVAIYGLPGTGKTTELERILTDELNSGVRPSSIAGVTFRRAMAEEFAERAGEVIGDDMPDHHWFRTTHSACFRLLDLEMEDVVDDEDRGAVCEDIGLEHTFPFDSDDEQEWATSDPSSRAIGDQLFHIRSFCLNSFLDPVDDWRKVDLHPEVRQQIGATHGELVKHFNEVYEEYKRQRGLVDFEDMLIETLEAGLVPPVRVLMEDEFQDKTPLQVALYEMWASEIERTYVAGDPNQCIPAGEPVLTPDGEVPIETLEEGDEVMSACGKGRAKPQEVVETHSRRVDEPILAIETESGKMRCTRDHRLFARLPDQGQADEWHYVYVMKSDGGDYRVGVTSMPHHRFRSEPNTTGLMIVEAHPDEETARLREKVIAYRYGLPQDPFKAREGVEQATLDEVFRELDTGSGFRRLCDDFGLDESGWNITARGTTVGEASRVAVGLIMCRSHKRRSGRDNYNTVSVETSNESAVEVLRSIDALNESDGREDCTRFRLQSVDLRQIKPVAKEAVSRLEEAGIPAHLDEKAALGYWEGEEQTTPLPVIQASGVTEGMVVPVVDGQEVRYEKVVDVSRSVEEVTVHDLEVERTHNFAVGGIAVHNCIYGFMGTDPEFMYDAIDAAAETRVLEKSYRFGPDLWERASSILEAENVELPEIEPVGTTSVQKISMQDYERMVEDQPELDSLHLTRTNYLGRKIGETLEELGVPFTAVGRMPRWTQRMIDFYNGVVALHTIGATMGEEFGRPDFSSLSLAHVKEVVPALPADVFYGNKKPKVEAVEEADSISDVSLGEWLIPAELLRLPEAKTPFDALNRSSMGDLFDRYTQVWQSTHGYIGDVAHRISTIHASKGMQADAVFLFDGTTRRIFRDADPVAEARVWFVGATRAVNELYVVGTNESTRYDLNP